MTLCTPPPNGKIINIILLCGVILALVIIPEIEDSFAAVIRAYPQVVTLYGDTPITINFNTITRVIGFKPVITFDLPEELKVMYGATQSKEMPNRYTSTDNESVIIESTDKTVNKVVVIPYTASHPSGKPEDSERITVTIKEARSILKKPTTISFSINEEISLQHTDFITTHRPSSDFKIVLEYKNPADFEKLGIRSGTGPRSGNDVDFKFTDEKVVFILHDTDFIGTIPFLINVSPSFRTSPNHYLLIDGEGYKFGTVDVKLKILGPPILGNINSLNITVAADDIAVPFKRSLMDIMPGVESSFSFKFNPEEAELEIIRGATQSETTDVHTVTEEPVIFELMDSSYRGDIMIPFKARLSLDTYNGPTIPQIAIIKVVDPILEPDDLIGGNILPEPKVLPKLPPESGSCDSCKNIILHTMIVPRACSSDISDNSISFGKLADTQISDEQVFRVTNSGQNTLELSLRTTAWVDTSESITMQADITAYATSSVPYNMKTKLSDTTIIGDILPTNTKDIHLQLDIELIDKGFTGVTKQTITTMITCS